MDGTAQVLLALAVLCIVLAVIVTVLSDKDWAKVVAAVSAFLTIIFGALAVFRIQRVSRISGP
jgi:hypothetical protein